MSGIKQAIEDPVYFAKRNALYAAGKHAAHSFAEGFAPDIVNQLGGAATAFGRNAVGLTTVGLASAVSAGLVQMDYLHKRDEIAGWYQEELSAKLRKPAKEVKSGDLEAIAKNNRVVAEELGKAKRNRTFGIAFSFLATMAALTVIAFAMPHAPSLFHLASATAAEWGQLAINTAVGLATYNAVKLPLHWLGDKLFGLDKETTHDRIVELQREHELGKAISKEQVLGVFASAHPKLGRMIEARFGLPFDELTLADKQKAVAEVQTMLPLEQLTAQINSGETNVTELAFAVDGEMSGVHHSRMDNLKKPGRLHGMWGKLRHALHSHAKPEYLGMASLLPPEALLPAVSAAERSGSDFVQRLGLKKMDASMGYAKLIEQMDKQAVNAPILQTPQ